MVTKGSIRSFPVSTSEQATRLLLDSREVATLLGLGRTKVFELMAAGDLPVIRIGRSVRVPREALIAWIRQTAQLPPTKASFSSAEEGSEVQPVPPARW